MIVSLLIMFSIFFFLFENLQWQINICAKMCHKSSRILSSEGTMEPENQSSTALALPHHCDKDSWVWSSRSTSRFSFLAHLWMRLQVQAAGGWRASRLEIGWEAQTSLRNSKYSTAPLCQKEPVQVVRASDSDALSTSSWEEDSGKTQNLMQRLHLLTCLGTSQDPQVRAG